jgi:hypothetical protein
LLCTNISGKYFLIKSAKTNVGIYVSFSLFLAAFVVVFMFIFSSINIQKKLEKIIYYDCKYFDPQIMNKENYFIKLKVNNVNENPINNNPVILTTQPVGSQLFAKHHNRINSNAKLIANDGEKIDNLQKLKLEENNLNKIVEETEIKVKGFSCIQINENDSQGKGNDNVILNNNFIENIESEANKISPETSNKNENEIDVKITIPDYNSLTMLDSVRYDKRTFKTYLLDNIIMHHKILGLIFQISLIHPIFIRINELIFEVSLTFAINALLFTDTNIDKRASSPYKVSLYLTLSMTSFIH